MCSCARRGLLSAESLLRHETQRLGDCGNLVPGYIRQHFRKQAVLNFARLAQFFLTLPLLVEQRFNQIGDEGLRGAYAAAALLAAISLVVLLAMTVLAPGRRGAGR